MSKEKLETATKHFKESKENFLKRIEAAEKQTEYLNLAFVCTGRDKDKFSADIFERFSDTLDEMTSFLSSEFMGENIKRLKEGFK